MVRQAGQRRGAEVEPAVVSRLAVQQDARKQRVHQHLRYARPVAHQVDRQFVLVLAAPQIREGHDLAVLADDRAVERADVLVVETAERKAFLVAGLPGEPRIRHRLQLRDQSARPRAAGRSRTPGPRVSRACRHNGNPHAPVPPARISGDRAARLHRSSGSPGRDRDRCQEVGGDRVEDGANAGVIGGFSELPDQRASGMTVADRVAHGDPAVARYRVHQERLARSAIR